MRGVLAALELTASWQLGVRSQGQARTVVRNAVPWPNATRQKTENN